MNYITFDQAWSNDASSPTNANASFITFDQAWGNDASSSTNANAPFITFDQAWSNDPSLGNGSNGGQGGTDNPDKYTSYLSQSWRIHEIAKPILSQCWDSHGINKVVLLQQWNIPYTAVDKVTILQSWENHPVSASYDIKLLQSWGISSATSEKSQLSQSWNNLNAVADRIKLLQSWGNQVAVSPAPETIKLPQSWNNLNAVADSIKLLQSWGNQVAAPPTPETIKLSQSWNNLDAVADRIKLLQSWGNQVAVPPAPETIKLSQSWNNLDAVAAAPQDIKLLQQWHNLAAIMPVAYPYNLLQSWDNRAAAAPSAEVIKLLQSWNNQTGAIPVFELVILGQAWNIARGGGEMVLLSQTWDNESSQTQFYNLCQTWDNKSSQIQFDNLCQTWDNESSHFVHWAPFGSVQIPVFTESQVTQNVEIPVFTEIQITQLVALPTASTTSTTVAIPVFCSSQVIQKVELPVEHLIQQRCRIVVGSEIQTTSKAFGISVYSSPDWVTQSAAIPVRSLTTASRQLPVFTEKTVTQSGSFPVRSPLEWITQSASFPVNSLTTSRVNSLPVHAGIDWSIGTAELPVNSLTTSRVNSLPVHAGVDWSIGTAELPVNSLTTRTNQLPVITDRMVMRTVALLVHTGHEWEIGRVAIMVESLVDATANIPVTTEQMVTQAVQLPIHTQAEWIIQSAQFPVQSQVVSALELPVVTEQMVTQSAQLPVHSQAAWVMQFAQFPVQSQVVSAWELPVITEQMISQVVAIPVDHQIPVTQVVAMPVYSEQSAWEIASVKIPVMSMESVVDVISTDQFLLHNGQRIELLDISVESDWDSYFWRGQVRLASVNDYRQFKPGDAVELVLQGMRFNLVVQQRSHNETGNSAQRTYTLQLSSPTVNLSDKNKKFSKTWAEVSAKNAVMELAGTVDWRIVDWVIPSGRLVAKDTQAINVIRDIVGAAGAIVQTSADGRLIVQYKTPKALNRLSIEDVNQTFSDKSHIKGYTENYPTGEKYNCVIIADSEATTPEAIKWNIEYDNELNLLKVFANPWTENFTVTTTGHPSIQIGRGQVVYCESIEEIEFNNKDTPKTKYPVFQLTDYTWQSRPLGNITWQRDSNELHCPGYSVAKVRYVFRRVIFPVTHQIVTPQLNQFLVWADNESLANTGIRIKALRGSGDIQKADIISPLSCSYAAALQLGRVEMDMGLNWANNQVNVRFRPVAVGDIGLFVDRVMSESRLGVVTGVKHGLNNKGNLTTALNILQEASHE